MFKQNIELKCKPYAVKSSLDVNASTNTSNKKTLVSQSSLLGISENKFVSGDWHAIWYPLAKKVACDKVSDFL